MGKPAIEIDEVGKYYKLGYHQKTLAERLARLGSSRAETEQGFWALRDVSLQVAPGEVAGLVGRNGAGKSTLLRLLAKIARPTEGRIVLRGRVGTLLEVGTGFHPELSGRDNIELSGAILGMRRDEIARRFDEIVDFAGIERFLDTPVKRYSSGMYVRLAFAVAAHLESEILLVDEVLAVGDIAFQQKCLRKMRDLVGQGRTVIFVSHNLHAVEKLCPRCIWVDAGRVAGDGPTSEVMASYLHEVGAKQSGGEAEIPDEAERVGHGGARIRSVALLGESGEPTERLRLGEPFSVKFTVEVLRPMQDAVLEVGIAGPDGDQVVSSHSIDGGRPPTVLQPGRYEITAHLTQTLLPGEFTVDVGIHQLEGVTADFVEHVLRFQALNTDAAGIDRYPWKVVRGTVRAPSEWTVEEAVSGLRGDRPVAADDKKASVDRLL